MAEWGGGVRESVCRVGGISPFYLLLPPLSILLASAGGDAANEIVDPSERQATLAAAGERGAGALFVIHAVVLLFFSFFVLVSLS